MKKRYVLYKRGGVYYLEDTELHRRTSLQTHNRQDAEKLVQARNETLHPSALHLALGRTYLAASDPRLVERTWRLVMEQFSARGRESTRRRRERGMRSRAFDLIRDKRLIETTADDLRAVLDEKLFWSVLEHLSQWRPNFVRGKGRGLLRRFRHAAHAVDSTVIQLVANCLLSWAKHRRRKAAAKLHVRLNLQSLLPQCAIVKTAAEHDNTRAVEVCAGLQAGEITIFDKAYVWFRHLWQLTERGVFWVQQGIIPTWALS